MDSTLKNKKDGSESTNGNELMTGNNYVVAARAQQKKLSPKAAANEIDAIIGRLGEISFSHAIAGEMKSASTISDIRHSILMAERGIQDVSRCLKEAKKRAAETKGKPEDLDEVSNQLIQQAIGLQQAMSMLSGSASELL